MRQSLLLLLSVAVPTLGWAQGHPLDTLQAGHWYEVPNSSLGPVLPNPMPPGNTTPNGIMSAWNGGALDTARNRLLICGGGHQDYAGNEVYAFDIESMTWSRIWGPTSNGDIVSNVEAYNDGNPASRHTYGGLAYVPAVDAYWMAGGALWGGGGGSSRTWHLDLANTDPNPSSHRWEQKGNIPSGAGGLNVAAAYDPVTRKVYMTGRSSQTTPRLCPYDPANGTWSACWELPPAQLANTQAVVDPVRHLFLMAGTIWVRQVHLKTGDYTFHSVTPPNLPSNASAPGFTWDSAVEKPIAWFGGTSVYSFDSDAGSWVEHRAATGNTVSPDAPQSAGTYGRFQYIPSRNAYVLVNRVGGNVYFYKLSDGPGVPDDPVLPPAPTGLAVN